MLHMKRYFTLILFLLLSVLTSAEKKDEMSGRVILTLRGEGLNANNAEDVLLLKKEWPKKRRASKNAQEPLVPVEGVLKSHLAPGKTLKDIRLYFLTAESETQKLMAIEKENDESFVRLSREALKTKKPELVWNEAQQVLSLSMKSALGKKMLLMNVYKIQVTTS